MDNEIEREDDAHHSILAPIFFLYTLPVALLTVFAYLKKDSWSLFCLGLALNSAGTFCFAWLLRSWRTPLYISAEPIATLRHEPFHEIPAVDLSSYENQIIELQKQVSSYEQMLKDWHVQADAQNGHFNELIQKKERAEQQVEALLRENSRFKEEASEQQEEYKEILAEHQRTLGEQRETLERKQLQIQQFETKIRDLNYEIKTLLQLAERADEELVKAPVPRTAAQASAVLQDEIEVHTFEEALSQLKHCIDAAQRMVGNSPFGTNSRFKELSMDHFALDSRRLFDYLREMQNCTVFVFSPKENKMLFVNPPVRALLGYSADEFVQTFDQIVATDIEEWRTAINQLTFKNHCKLQLNLVNKAEEATQVQGLIGSIPTGVFRQYVLGIFF